MDTETATKGGNGKTDREAAEAALAAVPKPVAAHGAETSPVETDIDVKDRTLWLCRMPYGGSRMLAAAFRSIGLDTRVTPEEDSRTLELGGKYTSGDECYPQRIVLGDYMKLIEDEKLDPRKTAFLLPTANGPCRFGQYVGLLRRVLDDQGYEDVAILSFTSADGYAGVGEQASELIRTAWRAVQVQDILMKLLLMTRPYEVERRPDRQGLPGIARSHGRHRRPPGCGQEGADGRPQGRASARQARLSATSRSRRRTAPSSASWARSSAVSTPSPTTSSSATSRPRGASAGCPAWANGCGTRTRRPSGGTARREGGRARTG